MLCNTANPTLNRTCAKSRAGRIATRWALNVAILCVLLKRRPATCGS